MYNINNCMLWFWFPSLSMGITKENPRRKSVMVVVGATSPKQLSTSGHMSLNVRYGLFHPQGISIASRTYVNCIHALWKMRTPHHTCANHDAWPFLTRTRSNSSSWYTATWHAWTRNPFCNIIQRSSFSLISLLIKVILLALLTIF